MKNDPRWIRLLDLIKELSFLQSEEEEFVLASGRKSRHFFDMKPLMMHPESSRLLGELINLRLDEYVPDFIGGLELGAVPLTAITITSASMDCKRLGFMVRKEAKGRGGRKTNNPPGIEGSGIMTGGTVVILEDVTTTGASSLKAVKRIHSKTKCSVVGVISILDREEGGVEAFNQADIAFESLFSLSDIIDSL